MTIETGLQSDVRSIAAKEYSVRDLCRQFRTGIPRGQLARLAEQTPVNTVVTVSLVLAVLVITEATTSAPWLYLWSAVQIGLILLIYLRWRNVRGHDNGVSGSGQSLTRSGLHHAVLWAALSGLMWGGLTAFLSDVPPHIQMGLILAMGGMAAGASTTLAAVPQVAIVFILSCGMPVAVYHLAMGDQEGLFLAFVFSVFVAAMLGTSRVTYIALMRQLRAEEQTSELREANMLQEIAATVESATSTNDALRSCLDEIRKYSGCLAGHVYLLADDGSNELVSSGIWLDEDDTRFEELRQLTANSRIGAGEGFPGLVLEREKPIWKLNSANTYGISVAKDELIDSGESPRLKKIREAGIKAFMGFPVKVKSEVLAVVELFSDKPAQPAVRTIQAMSTVATILGRALERQQSENENRRIEARLQQAQKMEAVGQLTSGIAHDFNNMLAIVMGNLQLAEDAVKNDRDVREYLCAAMHGAQKGADLNMQLLTFSRQQVLEDKITNVDNIVRGMSGLLKRSLGEDIEIEATFGTQDCICKLDPAQLESAILNLANNARDAMPRGGKLCLGAAVIRPGKPANPFDAAEEMVRISVSDSGSGMSEEVIGHALEPFFTTKEVGAGSGLGLSMVHGFVTQAGGEMQINSELGKGTAIHMMFPRAIAVDGVSDISAGSDELPRASNGEVVLVVEDQKELRDVIVAYLRDLDYQVLAAEDGNASIKILESNDSIDIILSDLVLPGGMRGEEVVAKARRILPGLKVLYMSGNPLRSAKNFGSDRTQIPMLRKPFSKADLARAVRGCLDKM